MKVERPGAAPGTSAAGRVRRPSAATGGDFARALERASAKAPASPAAAPSSVDSLLMVQLVEDATEGRKRARRRAEAMLNVLDQVRHDLLVGAIPRGRLRELAALCRIERSQVDDPALKALIDEVELRARVELAKWSDEP
jgi:hypothetical protein